MQINPQRYIYPPRPNGCTPRGEYDIFISFGWQAQLKFNDTRLLIKMLNGQITLWNRHGIELQYIPTPDLQEQLGNLYQRLRQAHPGSDYFLLDGGLLHNKHRAIKDTIVIWDMLVCAGHYQLGSTYQHRYDQIWALVTDEPYQFQQEDKQFTLGRCISTDILVPENIPTPEGWEEAWELVDAINEPYLAAGNGPLIEGLVFKDLQGQLELGLKEKNNQSWSARSRVTTARHAF